MYCKHRHALGTTSGRIHIRTFSYTATQVISGGTINGQIIQGKESKTLNRKQLRNLKNSQWLPFCFSKISHQENTMFWIRAGYFLRKFFVNYLELPNNSILLRNYIKTYYILLILTFISFVLFLLYTITNLFFLERWIDQHLVYISFIVLLSITLFPVILWLMKFFFFFKTFRPA